MPIFEYGEEINALHKKKINYEKQKENSFYPFKYYNVHTKKLILKQKYDK